VKVSIDKEMCQGHARCHDLEPSVFGLDDIGHAFTLINDVPAALEHSVTAAEATCPERAIVIHA
jgi:ferredoxin